MENPEEMIGLMRGARLLLRLQHATLTLRVRWLHRSSGGSRYKEFYNDALVVLHGQRLNWM
jgi:hypothetical protein